MPKNMSFALTTDQIIQRQKRVTRRGNGNGPTWTNLKPGEIFNGVKKAMGLKKGEKIERIAELICVDNRIEPLNAITQSDVIAEGFPDWTPEQFVEFYCKHNGVDPTANVSRIEFDYLY